MIGKEKKIPENFLNKGTSDGLVSITMPSFSNTFIGSWTRFRHVSTTEKEEEEEKATICIKLEQLKILVLKLRFKRA